MVVLMLVLIVVLLVVMMMLVVILAVMDVISLTETVGGEAGTMELEMKFVMR